jgi:hypothetical protein
MVDVVNDLEVREYEIVKKLGVKMPVARFKQRIR